LAVDALEKLVQGGSGCVLGEEVLIIVQAIAEGREIGEGDVEQRAPLEVGGIHPIGDTCPQAVLAQLVGQARRVAPGLLRGRLDGHHDIVELAEVLEILAEEHDVAGVPRQQAQARRHEADRVQRVGEREGREDERQRHRPERPARRASHDGHDAAAHPGRGHAEPPAAGVGRWPGPTLVSLPVVAPLAMMRRRLKGERTR
jgi:hypothetical protein